MTFALALGTGIAALIVLALGSERSESFTLGVRSDAGVVKLRPGDEVCQRPVDVVESFDRVRVQLGTYGRPGSPYSLEVRPAGAGLPLAGATVAGRYAASSVQSVRLSRTVHAGREVAVCIRNKAPRPVAVFGSSDLSNRASSSYLDGRHTGADLMMVFESSESRNALELLPAIVRRASLFHGGWASPAAYWGLLVLLLGGLATLPALALRSALPERADPE